MNEKHPNSGGKDAVILNYDSPYDKAAFDNHNMATSTTQFLSVLLAFNKTASFRELWDVGQKGELKQPEKMEDLICAFVVLSKALDWLWTPDEALKNVAKDKFPDYETAKIELTDVLGKAFVQHVVDTFPTE